MPPAPTASVGVTVNNNNESESDKDNIFPYKIQEVEEGTNRELLTLFTGEKTGFLQVGPKKWFLPSGYKREANNFYNFVARPNDVFVVTFPRSGTTWAQEMVWLLANNLDYKKATQIPLRHRFPFLEFSCFVHRETKAKFLKETQFDADKYQEIQNLDYPAHKYLDEITEQRFIKTHLPFSLLPPNLLDVGCKVIYIARNPKDVAVSFYHLNRAYRTQGYTGDFTQFWKYFQNGLVAWAPYWEHIKEGWSRRNESNLLFFFYEDMTKNIRPAFQNVSKFLGKSYTDEEFSDLENHLRIDNFKNNVSVNNEDHKELGIFLNNEESFVRRGVIGGWKSYFDEELNAEADRWIQENLRTSDIKFPKSGNAIKISEMSLTLRTRVIFSLVGYLIRSILSYCGKRKRIFSLIKKFLYIVLGSLNPIKMRPMMWYVGALGQNSNTRCGFSSLSNLVSSHQFVCRRISWSFLVSRNFSPGSTKLLRMRTYNILNKTSEKSWRVL